MTAPSRILACVVLGVALAPSSSSQSHRPACDAGDDGTEPCRIRILPISAPLKVGQLNGLIWGHDTYSQPFSAGGPSLKL